MLHSIATPCFSGNSWQFPKNHQKKKKKEIWSVAIPKEFLHFGVLLVWCGVFFCCCWGVLFVWFVLFCFVLVLSKGEFTHKDIAAAVITETQSAKLFFFSKWQLLDFILQKAEVKVLTRFLWLNGRRKQLLSEGLCWTSAAQRDHHHVSGQCATAVWRACHFWKADVLVAFLPALQHS